MGFPSLGVAVHFGTAACLQPRGHTAIRQVSHILLSQWLVSSSATETFRSLKGIWEIFLSLIVKVILLS